MSEFKLKGYVEAFFCCCAVGIFYFVFRYDPLKLTPSQSSYTPLTGPTHRPDSPLYVPPLETMIARKATADYWKAVVADLHKLRFAPDAESNAPLRSMRKYQMELQIRLGHIESLSRLNVDQDLVRMVVKHLAQDKEILGLLSQYENEAIKIGISENSSPTQAQIEAGWQLLDDLQADPSLMERLPPELRNHSEFFHSGVRCLKRLTTIREEQFHDIELMQARLQGRYAGGKFSLPALDP